MVIEWTSPVPVWSDTLHPEPSNLSAVIEAALRANGSQVSAKRRPSMPKQPSSYVDSHPQDNDTIKSSTQTSSAEPPVQTETAPQPLSPVIHIPRRRRLPIPKSVAETQILERPGSKDKTTPGSIVKPQHDRNITPSPKTGTYSVDELGDIEPMAVGFLQR